MHYSTLAAFALAGLASASPIERDASPAVIDIPLTHYIAPDATAAKVVAADQSRHADRLGLSKRQSSVTVTNTVFSYLASVKFGSQTFSSLIVDTGSSNTWAGAQTRYSPGSTSVNTGKTVSVSYGSGSFSGKEYTDTVTLGSVVVTGQGIGAATTSTGFTGVDGIFGFGPVGLTANTVSGTSSVPTFLQNAAAQGKIPANILGVKFKPAPNGQTANGVLTLGGASASGYTGSITYGPISRTSPASRYWGIDVSFSSGSSNYGSTSGIVDTGTSLLYVPSNVATSYFSGSGFAVDSTSGLYRARTTSAVTKPLTVTFAGRAFTLTAAQTVVPTSLYSQLGLTSGYTYSWIANSGSTGTGLDTILGQKFLENFYSVYDVPNQRVGFATVA